MISAIFIHMAPSLPRHKSCIKRRVCLLVALVLPLAVLHAQPSSDAIWQLGWRMFLHAEQKQWALADREFDTLYQWSPQLDRTFYVKGLQVKHQLGKTSELQQLLKNIPEAQRREVCNAADLYQWKECAAYAASPVTHPDLQLKLLLCQVRDQYARGTIPHVLMKKYSIDSTAFPTMGPAGVDHANRDILQAIFETYGMPTKAMVGQAGMEAVFLVLQHADGDPVWQKEQLPKVKVSMEQGDFEPQNYAYLFDRVQLNNQLPQRYGTQLKRVDFKTKTIELHDTEAPELLDDRRRAIGLMPVAVYKALVIHAMSQ